MFDGKLIQGIRKRFSRKHTWAEQGNNDQKQPANEERVTTAEALPTHDQPAHNTQSDLTEKELLVQAGFTSEEVLALFWLRQWYQNGGSDRMIILRHLQFLKRLLENGRLQR